MFQGVDASTNYHVHLVKYTFPNSPSDWAKSYPCSLSICSLPDSESIKSADGT